MPLFFKFSHGTLFKIFMQKQALQTATTLLKITKIMARKNGIVKT